MEKKFLFQMVNNHHEIYSDQPTANHSIIALQKYPMVVSNFQYHPRFSNFETNLRTDRKVYSPQPLPTEAIEKPEEIDYINGRLL
jgi:hypothetical protein